MLERKQPDYLHQAEGLMFKSLNKVDGKGFPSSDAFRNPSCAWLYLRDLPPARHCQISGSSCIVALKSV